MKNTVTVTVTYADIEQGTKPADNPHLCPSSRAVARAFGFTRLDEAEILPAGVLAFEDAWEGDENYRKFVADEWENLPLKPMTFKLTLVGTSSEYELKWITG